MDSFQIFAAVLTAMVATYGAVLSTINYIYQIKQNEPLLNISLSRGFMLGGLDDSTYLFFNISNKRNRSSTVSSIGLTCKELGNSKMAIMAPHGNFPMPHELKDGKSVNYWVSPSEVARELRSHGLHGKIGLIAYVNDSIGNYYKSKRFDFDLDYWQ